MTRLRIKNWAEFQHYRTRRPPWIKLHRGLLDDFAWHCLPEASRALGPMLWLLASETADGAIPYRLETIAFRLHMTSDKVDAALGPLIGAGFLIEEPDASEPLAAGKQPALPEREKETETKKERERDARAHEVPTKVPETIASAARARGNGLAKPIPEGWQARDADLAWAAKARPDLGPALLEAETERFRNHAIGNNRLAHDWGHLWRNWVMKADRATLQRRRTFPRSAWAARTDCGRSGSPATGPASPGRTTAIRPAAPTARCRPS
jgi:hypothetical protein